MWCILKLNCCWYSSETSPQRLETHGSIRNEGFVYSYSTCFWQQYFDCFWVTFKHSLHFGNKLLSLYKVFKLLKTSHSEQLASRGCWVIKWQNGKKYMTENMTVWVINGTETVININCWHSPDKFNTLKDSYQLMHFLKSICKQMQADACCILQNADTWDR